MQECFGGSDFFSSNPSESTLPKQHTGSAEGKTLPQRCWRTPRQQLPKTSTLPFRHHRLVILAWATGVWEGTPDLDTMQAALRGSLARLSHLKRPLVRRNGRSRRPLCSRMIRPELALSRNLEKEKTIETREAPGQDQGECRDGESSQENAEQAFQLEINCKGRKSPNLLSQDTPETSTQSQKNRRS